MNGHWLTISEYSEYRRKSVSTIRRYIKSNQVQYKQREGKYLIYVSPENYERRRVKEERTEVELRLKIVELEGQIKRLEEENNDFRMLIELYEKRKKSTKNLNVVNLPEIPYEN